MKKVFKSALLLGVAGSLSFFNDSNNLLRAEDFLSIDTLNIDAPSPKVVPVSFTSAVIDQEEAEDAVVVSFNPDLYSQASKSNHLVLPEGRANPLYQQTLDQGLLPLIDCCYEKSKAFGLQKTLEEEAFPDTTAGRTHKEEIKRKKYFIEERAKALEAELASKGWTVVPYFGKTGFAAPGTHGSRDDLTGIIAARDGKMVVIPCGSKDKYDWEVNFSGHLVHAHEVGLSIKHDPLVHSGFGHMLASSQESLFSGMKRLMPVAGPDATIVVSGHSQGAGVGALLSMLLADSWAKSVWGQDYSNVEQNRVKAILFSAPRALGAASAWAFDKVVGKSNVIRQNVHGDPVPVAQDKEESPLKSATLNLFQAIPGGRNLIARVPQFQPINDENSLDPFTGVGGVGILALDSASGAIGRAGHGSGLKAALAPLHYGETIVGPDGTSTTRFSPTAIGDGSNIDELLYVGASHQKSSPFYEGGIKGAVGTVTSGVLDGLSAMGAATLRVATGVLEAAEPLVGGVSQGATEAYAHLAQGMETLSKTKTPAEAVSVAVPAVAKAAGHLVWETGKGTAKASVPLLKRTAQATKDLAAGLRNVAVKAVKATAQIGVSVARGLKSFGSWVRSYFS